MHGSHTRHILNDVAAESAARIRCQEREAKQAREAERKAEQTELNFEDPQPTKESKNVA